MTDDIFDRYDVKQLKVGDLVVLQNGSFYLILEIEIYPGRFIKSRETKLWSLKNNLIQKINLSLDFPAYHIRPDT